MEYISKVLFFLGAIGVFNSFLVGVFFVFDKRRRNLPNLIFGLFLCALNFRVAKSLFYSFSTEEPIYFLQSGPSLFLLIGPLFFSYVISKTHPNIWISKNWKSHTVFWLFVAIVLKLIYPFGRHIEFNKETLLPIINLQWLAYILFAMFALLASTQSSELLKKWLALLTTSVFVLWAIFFFSSFEFFISGSIAYSAMFYTFFLYFAFNKKDNSFIFPGKKKNKSRSLKRNNELITALNTFMKEVKPYKKSDLKSIEVANELGIPLHDFSSFINGHFGKNFSDFINEYRVEEAKHLIFENPNYTLDAIGNMSGFNSKSAFYRALRNLQI